MRNITVNSESSNKHQRRLLNFQNYRGDVCWRVVLKESGVYKSFGFLNINMKILNMEHEREK